MSNFLPELLQQLFNGLSLGAIYALIAIGYTMVYGIIGMINFAHGEIYMIGAYVGLVTLSAVGVQGGLPVWLVIALMIIVAVLVTAVYGYAVEQLAYKPLRDSPRLVPLISAIGMSIFLQNWMALGQGARDMAVPALIPGAMRFGGGSDGGFEIFIPYARVLVIAVTVVLMVLLTLYIRNSRMGRASRACSQDMHMANLLGIDTNRVISFTFVLGAVLAAVGGVLIALAVGKLNPFIGFIAGIKAFTAAVLGGIGSIPGAMLGGVILGIAETLAAAYISSEYKDIVAFLLLVLILMFRPTGLLGKPEVEKV
ncbi:MAG: branched-chain amino acid ABC transporter permease LivH [Comamonas sp. SCN 67-35]|uniref:high-affinity branched-chain amino acid ABC transporter permease LivH n=1 Tax=unclassified Comamonas TaxID=2638500 RepID=UPI00086F6239|nr:MULTISPECIES: high-affinity branched-chain amino acid ABC transporter permease LivH [unclassified Comamonas]MBN9331325.1 high-affinity branched-chain amino acid ABC transporter permease LivH [Comamonas sp.]ODU37492.1 MAG: branched-chain amino acid ABC transporter permease LivH [Comamonas sp. SCN 67-35]OJX02369.1 MAG: branched-chain amino acid ABC transporter permease LivH [Burkholderiales bacterium 66-26]